MQEKRTHDIEELNWMIASVAEGILNKLHTEGGKADPSFVLNMVETIINLAWQQNALIENTGKEGT
jgi:hypothetical protein